MYDSSNIATILRNSVTKGKDKITELHDITLLDRSARDKTILNDNNGLYTFQYNDKNYNFRCLSDFEILSEDKKILIDEEKRRTHDFANSIKIALSKGLNYQKLITVVQENNDLILLVEYKKNGIKYIVNYSMNIIMKKDDYYDLFKPKEISILDKEILFILMDFIDKLPRFNIFYVILFSNEIFSELKKNFPFLNKNFSKGYFHINDIYVLEDPYVHKFYDVIIGRMDKDIQDFTKTLNPCDNITYDACNNYYLYDDSIPFRLLSDYLPDRYSDILFSERRYRDCHINSRKVLNEIEGGELVSGQIKVNNIEYFYHSWVEKDDIVYDFNRNLVMRKDDYYKMLNARVINRSKLEVIDENDKFIRSFKFKKDKFILLNNYFSNELNREFKNHTYLLESQKDSN